MRRYFGLLLESIRIIWLYRNWFQIISNHFRADRRTNELVLRNGVRYRIHPGSTDMGLVHEIHAENIYQIRRGDIGNNAVVIDIGAHIGVFSVFAATQAENVTVYSFEPDPDNFGLLVSNIAMNHLQGKIHPFNLAVSNTTQPKKLIRSADSVSAHSFFPSKFDEGEVKDSVEVGCTTLADILEKNSIARCHVLKLDCEGEEYSIMLDASDEVTAKITKIVGEYHDGLTRYSHEDLSRFLKSRGFKVEIRESRSFPTFKVGFLYALNTLTNS